MTFPADLPDDIDALKAIILASQAKMVDQDGIIERKEDRIIRLEKLLADFKRALYGAKSEKANPDQYHLALEDIETTMAVVHAEDEATDPPKTAASKSRAGRGVLPKHLPRVEEIIAPDLTCGCGAQQRRKMGLNIQDGTLIAKIAMNNPMTDKTVRAQIEFGVLLDLLEMGVTNAWTYNIKSPTQVAGQVVTKRPLGQTKHVPIARIIANAKAGQQARTRDRSPLNLCRSNLYILGNLRTTEGRVGNAKADTRAQAKEDAQRRAAIARKRQRPDSLG